MTPSWVVIILTTILIGFILATGTPRPKPKELEPMLLYWGPGVVCYNSKDYLYCQLDKDKAADWNRKEFRPL